MDTLRPKYFIRFGICQSIQIPFYLIEKGVTTISLYLNIDTFIFLHHPNQFMSMDTITKVKIQQGKKYFFDMHYNFMEDTLAEKSKIPCSKSNDFEFDDCLYSKLESKLIQNFNCTVPFLPGKNGKICDKNLEKIFEFYEFQVTNGQNQLCTKPCTSMEIFLGLPFDVTNSNKNQSYVKWSV